MAEPRRFSHTARTLGLAWIALLLLMLASLGSSYLSLGPWNMVGGLAIAATKAAIVAWLFMRLRDSGPLIRLVAVAGLGLWSIQVMLSGLDYATRSVTPSVVQSPQQLPPLRPGSQPH
jgi:cytochrome c oxidase subunit IV